MSLIVRDPARLKPISSAAFDFDRVGLYVRYGSHTWEMMQETRAFIIAVLITYNDKWLDKDGIVRKMRESFNCHISVGTLDGYLASIRKRLPGLLRHRPLPMAGRGVGTPNEYSLSLDYSTLIIDFFGPKESCDLKMCAGCRQIKPYDQYSSNRTTDRNGLNLMPRCKDCMREVYIGNKSGKNRALSADPLNDGIYPLARDYEPTYSGLPYYDTHYDAKLGMRVYKIR